MSWARIAAGPAKPDAAPLKPAATVATPGSAQPAVQQALLSTGSADAAAAAAQRPPGFSAGTSEDAETRRKRGSGGALSAEEGGKLTMEKSSPLEGGVTFSGKGVYSEEKGEREGASLVGGGVAVRGGGGGGRGGGSDSSFNASTKPNEKSSEISGDADSEETAAEVVVDPAEVKAAQAAAKAEAEAKAEEDAARLAEEAWKSVLGMLGRDDGFVVGAEAAAEAVGVLGAAGTTVGDLVHRGLVNTGNSCFRSAVLQALLACEPFVR